MKNDLVTSCARRSTISLAIDMTLEGKDDMTERDPDVFELEIVSDSKYSSGASW